MRTLTILVTFIFFFLSTLSFSQNVSINATGDNPDGSAMLDVKSTDKGILIPRMTKAQRDAIATPATGLMVFQTDNNPGFYFYDGSNWRATGWETLSIDDLTDGKTGGYSVFLGDSAGTNDDGSNNHNTGVGYESLTDNTTGYNNTAMGYLALSSNTTGSWNTAMGVEALKNNNGNSNIAIGYWSMLDNTSGANNLGIGNSALQKNTFGTKNIGIGDQSVHFNTTGSQNVALGYHAVRSAAGFGTISHNTGIGSYALEGIRSGENTAVGAKAMQASTTATQNVAIGYEANIYNIEGDYNTMVGYQAGRGTTGTYSASYNVFLGYQAGYSETGSNKLYIENSNSSSPLLYGEFDNDLLRINGTLDINDAYQFPTSDGINGQVLKTDGSGASYWTTHHGDFANGGEAGGIDRSLGNTDTYALSLKTDNIQRMKIFADGGIRLDGNLGIFTDPYDATSINKAIDLYAAADFSNAILSMSGHNSSRITLESRRVDATSGKKWELRSGGGTTGVLDRFAIYNQDDGYVFNIRNGGNVGIGTDTPASNLHISGIEGLLVNGGTLTSGTNQSFGAGQRMHFYPKKAAFRVGEATATEWDDANIGDHSIAMGRGTTASGDRSVAMGEHTSAISGASTALGYYTTASGTHGSTAIGYYTTASGQTSFALGNGIEASGKYAVAIALNNQLGTTVSQDNTLAIMGGKVGIGTITPEEALQVAGNFRLDGALEDKDGEAGNNGQFLISTSTATDWIDLPADEFTNGGEVAGVARTLGNTDAYSLGFLTNNLPRIHIASDGKIGIGTTSPAHLMEIESSVSTELLLQNTGDYVSKLIYQAPRNGSGNAIGNLEAKWENNLVSRIEFLSGGDNVNKNAGEISFATATGGTIGVRMSIKEDGKIGIGTNTPDEKLHVAGNLRLDGTLEDKDGEAGTSGQILSSTATGTDWIDLPIDEFSDGGEATGADRSLGNTDAYGLSLLTNAIERLYISSDGNVGIGTTSPNKPLEVNGDTWVEGNLAVGALAADKQISFNGTVGDGLIKMYNTGNLFIGSDAGVDISVSSGNTFKVQTYTGSWQDRLTIANNGTTEIGVLHVGSDRKIGIGTLTPSSLLDVNGTTKLNGNTLVEGSITLGSTVPDQHISFGGTVGNGIIKMYDTGEFAIGSDNNVAMRLASGSSFKIQTYSGSLQDRFYISSLGNVGIGTTSPNQKLEVNGNTWIEGNLSVGVNSPDKHISFTGTAGNSIIKMYDSGVFAVGTDDNVDIRISSGNTFKIQTFSGTMQDRFFIANDGKVGIGTTTPSGILDIAGNYHFPSTDGTANQVLKTDGSGVLSWSDDANTGATQINELSDGINSGGSLFLGSLAGLNDDGTNNLNTGIGHVALAGNGSLSGEYNVALGPYSLAQSTTGDNNIGIGFEANYWNQAGSNNTIVGYQAGKGGSAHSKSGNVFLGYQAGLYEGGSNKLYIENSNSSDPLIYGDFSSNFLKINGSLNINNAYQFPISDGNAGEALTTNGSGSLIWAEVGGDFSDGGEAGGAARTLGNTDNFALGFLTNGTEQVHIDATGNLGIGTNTPSGILDIAGNYHFPSTDGTANQVLKTDGSGTLSWSNDVDTYSGEINDLSDGITGGYSVFLGESSGSNDDGSNNNNAGVGYESLAANTSGSVNTAMGYRALSSNTTGSWNTAMGSEALRHNNGNGNIAIGYWSMLDNTSGANNLGIGNSALQKNTSGTKNIGIGEQSVHFNTTGSQNVALGYHAVRSAAGFGTISHNTGIGSYALEGIRSGENTAVGAKAMQASTTATQNVAIGYEANIYNLEGDYNTMVGYQAGRGTTATYNASYNVFLGYQAGYSETGSNKLYIENSNSSAPLLYGEFDNDLLRINGTLDINDAYQFPTVDGTNGQFLKTNGNGTLSWANGLSDYTDGGEAGGGARTLGNTDNYALGFLTNNTNRLHIENDGDIGLGTTTPNGQFEVYQNNSGGVTAGDFVVDTDNKTVYVGRLSTTSYNSSDFVVRNRLGHETFVVSNTNYISLGNYNGGNEQMRVVFDGNTFGVGIGTTTPAAKLHVAGNFRLEGSMNDKDGDAGTSGQLLSSTASGTDWIDVPADEFSNGGEAGGATRTIGNTDNFSLGFLTNSTNRLHIEDDGDVGIGTTSPNAQLDVIGKIMADKVNIRNPYIPTSSTDSNGEIGDISWDANYLYIKTGAATWKRIALDGSW